MSTFKELMESLNNISPTVNKKQYGWGKMVTIQHGNHFSIPLHPEHQELISKLEDEQSGSFKDETGKKWNVSRKDDNISFNSGSLSTSVGRSKLI